MTLGWALAGCAAFPLSEVPVEAADPEVRDRLIGVLEQFESEAVLPVQLSEVVVEPRADRGGYNRSRRRISLSDELTAGELEWAARHELCHALDLQNDLSRPGDVPIAAFAEDMRQRFPLTELYREGPGWLVRTEAFAWLCQQSPVGFGSVGEPCPDDPPGFGAVGSWVAHRAWGGRGREGTMPEAAVAGPEGSSPVKTVTATALSATPSIFALHLDLEDDGHELRWVDRRTGEEVPEPDRQGYISPPDERPPGWPPDPAWQGRDFGLADGPAAVVFEPDLLQLGPAGRRVATFDGETWGTRCAHRGEDPLYASDGLYTLWLEGDRVVWADLPL